MKLRQISVFLENRVGRLAEVAKVIGDAGINIRALSLADTSDFGILRLIVNDSGKAHDVLKKTGFTVNLTDVVAVEVEDRPGGLAGALGVFNKAGLNVEYMYAFVEKVTDRAVLVFRFEDVDKAVTELQKTGMRVLSTEDVAEL